MEPANDNTPDEWWPWHDWK